MPIAAANLVTSSPLLNAAESALFALLAILPIPIPIAINAASLNVSPTNSCQFSPLTSLLTILQPSMPLSTKVPAIATIPIAGQKKLAPIEVIEIAVDNFCA